MVSIISESGNPFPGLRSFEPGQAHLFFGRDDQVKELIARLRSHRFLPIVGMSGSGKSSLVRAGLIPALTDSYVDTEISGWRIAVLRPGRNPMHELAATLCRELTVSESDVLQILRGSSAGLARVAQQHLGREEKLLVLVDQFEELFRYREDANTAGETGDDAAFVKLLLAAAGESEHPLPGFDDLPVYVVTTMRSDFLGNCSRFRGLPEALNHSQYLIPRLTREQQRDVIEGPILMAGASIEPILVQQLLNDLGDNPDQLPALQHSLMRTWEQSSAARAQGKAIEVADYEAVGGMADALNRDADRVYESLADDAKSLTRCLFQRLIRPAAADAETRSPTPLSELVAVTAANEHAVRRVIGVFEQRGFLTVSSDKDPIIDITHESLIRGWRRLAEWVQEETRWAAIYRRLADQATLYANKEASVLIDPQLQLTLNWREETKPNEAWAARYDSRFAEAMAFLEQSRNEQHDALERAEQQRRSKLKRARVITLVLGTLLVLAIGALVFAAIQRNRALAERDRSSRLLYDSNIYFASGAVASGQVIQARRRLDELLEPGLRELRGFEWFYLWQRSHAEEATLSGHSGPVHSIAFSPDGKTFATGGDDNKVKLWDIATRKEVATLSSEVGSVDSVVFSPDGKILAFGGYDRKVTLWDTATRQDVATLSGHEDEIKSLAFSPDGKILAAGGYETVLWDTATHKKVATLSGHSATVMSVAFSPDGKTLACGSFNTVKLWDTATRKELTTLSSHSGFVASIAFSPDGETLAASDDKTVKLWDTARRKDVDEPLAGHTDLVSSVAFSPDGKTLASGSDDKTVRLWDTATGEEVAVLAGHADVVKSVAFSPDGKILASASDDGRVNLWDTAATALVGHSVSSVAFSPDGKTLAAGVETTVRLWDTTAHKEVATLSGHGSAIQSLAFSPDGKTLASASIDKTVKLWDIATSKEVATLPTDSNSIAFSPDGKTLASASVDATVKLWDTATRKEVATLSGHSRNVWGVAFSPDGKTLASASDQTVKLWDTVTLTEVATLQGHSLFVRSVAFSPDGKTLASADTDNTIKLWDTTARKELATLSGHSRRVRGDIFSIAFSPDGKTLASASEDKTVKLWDTVMHKEVATLSGHSESVTSVAFSPDGKILASVSDNIVRLWFAATDEEVEKWRRRQGY